MMYDRREIMSFEITECSLIYRKYFPFWDHLTDEQRGLLCANTTARNFPKGTNIHGLEDACTGAILVVSGCLRAYLLSENGREVTLYRFGTGEVCMLSASCVLKSITFDVVIDAEEDSEVCIVRGDIMARVADENLYVENYALDNAVKRFSDVVWVMQQIMFLSLDKRIAVFLWDEMSRTGSTEIKMTHEQIAKYISSAREAVTRMLKYFAGEGILELSRKGIRITDKKKLRELIS